MAQIHIECKKNIHLAKSGTPSYQIDRTKINELSTQLRKLKGLPEIKQKPVTNTKKVETKVEVPVITRDQLTKKKLVTIPKSLVNMGKKNGPFPDGIMSVKFRNGKLETKKYVPESKTLEVKEQDTVNETLSSSPVLVEKPVTKVEEPKDPKMEELIKYFESLSPALREQLIKGKDKSQASSWWSLSS
jgi:hypothetical protein